MTDFDDYFADPVALAHRIDDYRDALAAVAEALNVPRGPERGMKARIEWLEARSDRIDPVRIAIEWILKPGAPVADHVQYLREEIAEWRHESAARKEAADG